MRAAAVLVALLYAAAPLGAQESPGPSTQVEEAVRGAVARAWSVPPETVVLDWGSGGLAAADADVELIGSGAGGTWIARLTGPEGSAVAQRVRAGRLVRLPVATRRLERGRVLTVGDAELRETTEWGPPSGVSEPVATGWVTQRVVAAGDVLAAPAVRPPRAVTAGTSVELRFQRGAVRLDMVAVAAGSGVVGERVYVRTESGERVRGVIVAPGVVEMGGAGADNLQGSH